MLTVLVINEVAYFSKSFIRCLKNVNLFHPYQDKCGPNIIIFKTPFIPSNCTTIILLPHLPADPGAQVLDHHPVVGPGGRAVLVQPWSSGVSPSSITTSVPVAGSVTSGASCVLNRNPRKLYQKYCYEESL